MVGAGPFQHLVAGRGHALRLRPFLQRGLGVEGRRLGPRQPPAPQGQDHAPRDLEPAVQIDGGQHRLHRVAQKRVLAAAARLHLGPAQLQRVAQPDLARDLGAGLAAHQRVVARRKLAFGGVAVGRQQRLGHHEAQNPVAQELQPLVVWAGGGGQRSVGERPHQKLRPGEVVAQSLAEGAQVGSQLHAGPLSRSP